MRKKLTLLTSIIALMLAFTNCSDSDKEKEDAIKSDENEITLFALEGATSTTIDGNVIYVIFPSDNTETSHRATFTLSDKATASIQNGDYLEFGDKEIEIVVTAENGIERKYTVQTITSAGLQKAVLLIMRDGKIVRAYTAKIDEEKKTITFLASLSKMDEEGSKSYIDCTIAGINKYGVSPTEEQTVTKHLNEIRVLDKEAGKVTAYEVIFVDIDE